MGSRWTRTPQERGLMFFWIFVVALTHQEVGMGKEVTGREPDGELLRPGGHVMAGILFTPEGKYFVTFGKDRKTKQGTVLFWDLDRRAVVHTIVMESEVSALAFTPDGKRLVTAPWDDKMRIYAAPRWQLVDTFDNDPAKQTARNIAMLPSGQRFLSVNMGYSGPRMWNMKTLTAMALKGEKSLARALALSKDGKRFAVAYPAITVVWDTDRLEVIARLERKGVFLSVAFSPDGKWIAAGSIGPEVPGPRPLVSIWSAETFKKAYDCTGLSDDPRAITFTKDSKLLLACTGEERSIPAKLCIWEVESGKLVYAFSPHQCGCMLQALSSDNRWLVTCAVDGSLRLWDFAKIRREIGK
jgi:WD40 repeat protein